MKITIHVAAIYTTIILVSSGPTRIPMAISTTTAKAFLGSYPSVTFRPLFNSSTSVKLHSNSSIPGISYLNSSMPGMPLFSNLSMPGIPLFSNLSMPGIPFFNSSMPKISFSNSSTTTKVLIGTLPSTNPTSIQEPNPSPGVIIGTNPKSLTTIKPNLKLGKNCQFDMIANLNFTKAWKQCQGLTGFPAEKFTSLQNSMFNLLESTDIEDKCFGKCLLENMKLSEKDGSLNRKEFPRIFKSNATNEFEIQRIHGLQSCANKIVKEAESVGGIKSSCKFPIKFLFCGIHVELEILDKCRSK